MKVGVLALQGAFAAHAACLRALGAEPREVRTPAELDEVDALVLPGGESHHDVDAPRVRRPVRPAGRAAAPTGCPTLGTCAGMILLGAEILDGRADQRCFGAVDISVRRNAFGRQVDSFEADLAARRPRRRAASGPSSSGRRSSSGPGPTSRCSPPSTATPCCAARARSPSPPSTPSCRDDLRLHDHFLRSI